MATIFPPSIVKPKTMRGRPPCGHTAPAAPSMSAGRAARARPENVLATAAAPRTSLAAPMRTTSASARSTTSGSSSARRASKLPSREAARKASTTSRSRLRSASRIGAPCTRRRARLASCLAAVGERPTMGAISSNGMDLNRAKKFYSEGLGWPIDQEQGQWVCFRLGGGSFGLGLYPWDALADDAGASANGSGFRGITLNYIVRAEERVAAVLAEAERAGGKI